MKIIAGREVWDGTYRFVFVNAQVVAMRTPAVGGSARGLPAYVNPFHLEPPLNEKHAIKAH